MAERSILSTYRTGQVILVVGVLMASLFVASYSIALGRPMPRHIPTAIVGNPAQHSALIDVLQQQVDGSLEFHPYRSKSAAEVAMNRQTMKAALILGSQPPLLLVSSAASAPIAALLTTAVEQAGLQLAPHSAPPLHAVDIRPLPPTDPQGLIGFYVTFAATILGFSIVFNLRAHEPHLSPRAWLAFIGVLGVVGGLALTLVTDRMIGALRGSFPQIWAAVTTQITVTALFTSTMIVLLGRWAIVPAWLLFTAVGNPSAGGAVSAPMLPKLYAFFGYYLPTGATVAIVHNAAYFRDAQHLRPVVVQAAWLVGCLAAFLISVRALRWSPTREPEEPDEPAYVPDPSR
ncbi:MAG TPA: hypothetical protein VGP31_16340 [Planosporangium sp.]|nr:hypothetical protein [Planosporangium sp.]